jgi:hypothetical protein
MQEVEWYLVLDKSKFHVYVAMIGVEESIRIDWHKNSTLEFSPFLVKEGEHKELIGRAWYCQECIEEKVLEFLETYKLFQFNCRTVSYLLLTVVLGFEPNHVYPFFQKQDVMCGLELAQCFSPEEIHHFILYRRSEAENAKLKK